MGFYIFVAIILFVFVLMPLDKRQNDIVLFLSMLILVLFDSLRWENGTDWTQYCSYFERCLHSVDYRYEWGYTALNQLIRSVTNKYTVFLLIHALIMYAVLLRFFRNYSCYPLLSFFLFFVLFVAYQGMNRQFLALSFGYIGLLYLLSNKKAIYFLYIFLACLFHFSACILLVALFMRKLFKTRTYFIVLFISFFLAFIHFVDLFTRIGLAYLGGKLLFYVEYYSESTDLSMAGSGISIIFAYLRRLLVIIPFLVMTNIIPQKLKPSMSLFFNMYFFSFILYIVFNATIMDIIVSRASIYFLIFECILIPYLVYMGKRKYPKQLLLLLIFAYGIISMVRNIHRYDVMTKNPFLPYKAIYFNTDVDKYTD